MKMKKKVGVSNKGLDLKQNIKLTSDHRYLIFYSRNWITIYDSKSEMIIFKTKSIQSSDLNFQTDQFKLDRFNQNLVFFNYNNRRMTIGKISLKYLKIFQRKDFACQTLGKRYFKTDDLSLYNKDLRNVKYSQECLNDHLKEVFRNLGYDRDWQNKGKSFD